MLSHDNVTWTSMMCMEHYGWHQERILCYLPLSHMAAIMIDCFMPTYAANEVHFADSEALKGTLVMNKMKKIFINMICGLSMTHSHPTKITK